MGGQKEREKSTCALCKNKYYRSTSFQKWCSPKCGYELSQIIKKESERRRKIKRKLLKEKKESLMTRGEWQNKAERAFNFYIRERDYLSFFKQGIPPECICCGKIPRNDYKSWNAGHYKSVGSSPSLRFNEDNVHLQLSHCNKWRSGDSGEYRERLIEKIGEKRVEALEGPQEFKNYTIEDLKMIGKKYRKMARALKKEREDGG